VKYVAVSLGLLKTDLEIAADILELIVKFDVAEGGNIDDNQTVNM
jgi:hypothetical protein